MQAVNLPKAIITTWYNQSTISVEMNLKQQSYQKTLIKSMQKLSWKLANQMLQQTCMQ